MFCLPFFYPCSIQHFITHVLYTIINFPCTVYHFSLFRITFYSPFSVQLLFPMCFEHLINIIVPSSLLNLYKLVIFLTIFQIFKSSMWATTRENLSSVFRPRSYQNKVSKGAKIRNPYNQVPHLTQDTNGKVTNSQLNTTNENQEVSSFPAGDHKVHINRHAQRHSKHKHKRIHKRSTALERSVKYFTGGLKPA